MAPDFSIILPCYNEAGNIENILNRFRPLTLKRNFELILVENGSTDKSAEVMKDLLIKPDNKFARAVPVEKNQGYGFGLKTGLAAATAPVVSFTHADLQCPPENLIEAYEIYLKNNRSCLVKGRRIGRRPKLDEVVTGWFNFLSRLFLGIKADINAQPKLFDRSLVDSLMKGPNDFAFDLYVLAMARRQNIPIIEFDVDYEQRQWGQSKSAANPWLRFKTSMRCFRLIVALFLRIA